MLQVEDSQVIDQEIQVTKKQTKKQPKKLRWGKIATAKHKKHKTKDQTKKRSKKQPKAIYWEVEDILDERLNAAGKQEVLIKWENYSAKYNSWEPVSCLNDDLENVKAKIEETKEKEKEKIAKCKLFKENKEMQREENFTRHC